jgi:hypothetical protein
MGLWLLNAEVGTGALEMFRGAAAGWRESFTDEQLGDYRITRQLDKEEALPGHGGARKSKRAR